MRLPRAPQQYLDIATRLREAGGVLRLRAFCVLEFVKHLADVFPGLKVIWVPDDQMSHARAEANSATNTILARETLRSLLQACNPTARFVLVEEVCHIALNHKGPRFRRSAQSSIIYSRTEQRDESEARYLAALILAPAELAQDCNSAAEIAETFQLSPQASQIRWEEIQIERRRSQGVKRDLPEGVVDFLRERQRRGHKVTALVPE